MSKKTKSALENEVGKVSTIDARFSWILQTIFSGRQTDMARSLGIDQSILSRVVAGERRPSFELLAGAAGLSGLNSDWLLTGRGEPSTEDCAVPVARELLPDDPTKCPSLLSGEYVGIARHHFRPRRYFLELVPDAPIARAKDETLVAGDLLLLDPDLAQYIGKLALSPGLYVVQRPHGLRLARLAGTKNDNLTAIVFDVDGKGRLSYPRVELTANGHSILPESMYWWKSVLAKTVLMIRRRV